MPEEIEAKMKIADPEAFRRRMAGCGAAGGGTVFEVNHIFDSADGSLRKSGAAIRVREEQRAAGGEVFRTILTYKGPRQPGRLKRRAEVETPVADGAAILSILQALGYVETFHFEKRRTAWRLGECEVVLDELPHIGWFAEVEGPSEKAVQKVLADLGPADTPIVQETYMRLLADDLAARGRDPARAVFAAGSGGSVA
jgi:adenylate cyclase class 2